MRITKMPTREELVQAVKDAKVVWGATATDDYDDDAWDVLNTAKKDLIAYDEKKNDIDEFIKMKLEFDETTKDMPRYVIVKNRALL
jgi:hypothetical protein